MTKQGNNQSRGSGQAGAEIASEEGLAAALEPLLLVLEEPIGEKVADAVDAIGQILSSGSMNDRQVEVLVEAEDLLDEFSRVLEQAQTMVFGGGA